MDQSPALSPAKHASTGPVADSFLAQLDRLGRRRFFAHLVLVDLHLPYKKAVAAQAGVLLEGTVRADRP